MFLLKQLKPENIWNQKMFSSENMIHQTSEQCFCTVMKDAQKHSAPSVYPSSNLIFMTHCMAGKFYIHQMQTKAQQVVFLRNYAVLIAYRAFHKWSLELHVERHFKYHMSKSPKMCLSFLCNHLNYVNCFIFFLVLDVGWTEEAFSFGLF